MEPLDWFPKPFAAGDLDGVGALKMLDGASLPAQAVLVRETAQNSWDARVDETTRPRVSYHGFELTEQQLDLLRKTVFVDAGSGSGTGLAELLSSPNVNVLEIADRGTTGLGGPTRNDITFEEGVPTDWVDFVLTLGARQDTEHGGGTFGFGKVIAYAASSATTVLIWSKAIVDGKRCSRLIASAMGESFDIDNRRFNGRQWWGRAVDDRIEPLTGDEADRLAEQLFSEPFQAKETGTSILILGPDLTDSLSQLMDDISTAVLWNLWPKIIPDLDCEAPMPIAITLNGAPVPIEDPTTHPMLGGFVSSLQLIRQTQADDEVGEHPMSKISQLMMQRPKAVLGHLAVTTVPSFSKQVSSSSNTETDERFKNPIVPIATNASHIALMRNKAELVVTYESMPGEIGIGNRCGVFRPVIAVDNAFAKAEPPAHDSWEPAGVKDKATRRHVNVAFTRMKEEWRRMTTAEEKPSELASSGFSSAGLANELVDLVPGLSGTRAAAIAKTSSSKSSKKPKKSKSSETGTESPDNTSDEKKAASNSLNLVGHETVAIESGSRLSFAHIHVNGPPSGLTVFADIAAAFDGGTDAGVAESYIRGAGWFPGHVGQDQVSELDSFENEVSIVDEQADWTLAIQFDERISLSLEFRQKRTK